jgi:hypothetical protein
MVALRVERGTRTAFLFLAPFLLRRSAWHERRPRTGSSSGGIPEALLGPQSRLDQDRARDGSHLRPGKREYRALPHKTEYLAYGDNAVFDPATNWSVGYDQIMHEEFQAALLGQKSAEQALGDAQARLMDMASLQ